MKGWKAWFESPARVSTPEPSPDPPPPPDPPAPTLEAQIDQAPEAPAPPKPPRRVRVRDKRRPLTSAEAHVALGMHVAGMKEEKIAQALDANNPEEVHQALQRVPNVHEQMAIYRENLKVKKVSWIWDTEELLWTRIKRELPSGEAKDIDALYRAAGASEKIQSGLAGEALQIDMTAPPQPNVELKVLIQALGLDGLKELG
jgi:hypothetical protein